MKIFVCSQYSGDVCNNIEYAQNKCREVCLMGHIPFASHIFFTQFLDDNIPEEREIGIKGGHAFIDICDQVWVYMREGRISLGMCQDIEFAKSKGKTIYYFNNEMAIIFNVEG